MNNIIYGLAAFENLVIYDIFKTCLIAGNIISRLRMNIPVMLSMLSGG